MVSEVINLAQHSHMEDDKCHLRGKDGPQRRQRTLRWEDITTRSGDDGGSMRRLCFKPYSHVRADRKPVYRRRRIG